MISRLSRCKIFGKSLWIVGINSRHLFCLIMFQSLYVYIERLSSIQTRIGLGSSLTVSSEIVTQYRIRRGPWKGPKTNCPEILSSWTASKSPSLLCCHMSTPRSASLKNNMLKNYSLSYLVIYTPKRPRHHWLILNYLELPDDGYARLNSRRVFLRNRNR
jgi:hypothetical protein